MVKRQRTRWEVQATGLAVVVLWAVSAQAIYLDEQQNINLRARVYSQAAIRADDSSTDTVPTTKWGQLVQHRNFFNPELDVKLTSYTSWMRDVGLGWLEPDDLRFRLAAWGFYDGIYDYGADQFNRSQRGINRNYRNYNAGICEVNEKSIESGMAGKSCAANADCLGVRCMPAGGWFVEGDTLNRPVSVDAQGKVIPAGRRRIGTLDEILPDVDLLNPRDIYASQRRVNELYLSYSKGPVFLRLGRQSLSWGEADTIALLDQNNPFDVTLAAPGIFMDLDEARIPLWTVRASLNLFDTLGPFSSGFVESYWVPGDIDTNTGYLPILTASPYSPRGKNPQFSSGFPNETFQFILLDHVPKKRFENSRYGFRFQTVVNRFYTVQAWIYTHFPNAPAPRKGPPVAVFPGTGGSRTVEGSPLFISEVVHDLTTVYGLATTFFVERVDGILRLEAEYFENEPGFIPEKNLKIGLDPVGSEGTVPVSDIVRWEIGFDRFFFFRPLNPTNSFTLSASNVGAYNLDETGLKDFRAQGQRKPGKDVFGVVPVPDDFVQQKMIESFFQVTMLTDYLHGRLQPQVTFIQNIRGTFAAHPQLTYRWADWLLFKLDYVYIGGEYQSLGYFSDKSQFALRATYQLN